MASPESQVERDAYPPSLGSIQPSSNFSILMYQCILIGAFARADNLALLYTKREPAHDLACTHCREK